MRARFAGFWVLVASTIIQAQEPTPVSPRNANYDIDVRLDPATRTITGTEVIRWRNLGEVPADSLRLHLYWNAWQNEKSSWMREIALAGERMDVQPDDSSYINVTAVALADADGSASVELTKGLTFVQPDDGNADDRTLAAVPLPSVVLPGGDLIVRVQWTSRVPRTFARTGTIGNYYFVAQWFPKLAVFEKTGWTAHQFHANTEFFSDYGRYDVRMTVPQGWIVGATGTQEETRTNSDGTMTHRYVQDDVHDFAWTTSPDYREYHQVFEEPNLPRVDIRLLLQPEHAGQEDRHFAATVAALKYYGQWYGAYPYDHITVIDPAYQSGAGGMEYPTLFTAGTRMFSPRQSNSPEGVTVHEAGHQFWYALVGNNEFEDAWLDEGFNTFSEERVQSIVFQPNYRVERFFGGFIPWQFRDIPLRRETDGNGLNGYRSAAERDAPQTPTWRYWPGTHAQITYSKTALWMNTLERYLGWDTLQRIMSTYFARWRFKHPRPNDFFAVVNEVSGRDMTWFFDQVYRGSNVFDYAVERLETDPNKRTTVVVRRMGEAIFPVDVLVTFDNGEQARETWDGLDRWKAYAFDRTAGAVSAQVDPDRVLLLDVNYTNNSKTLRPKSDEAATKWSLKWIVWLQDLMLTWGFFA
jgi:peptidase M1-like protein